MHENRLLVLCFVDCLFCTVGGSPIGELSASRHICFTPGEDPLNRELSGIQTGLNAVGNKKKIGTVSLVRSRTNSSALQHVEHCLLTYSRS
jgi:hypothetical protein